MFPSASLRTLDQVKTLRPGPGLEASPTRVPNRKQNKATPTMVMRKAGRKYPFFLTLVRAWGEFWVIRFSWSGKLWGRIGPVSWQQWAAAVHGLSWVGHWGQPPSMSWQHVLTSVGGIAGGRMIIPPFLVLIISNPLAAR